MASLSQLKNWLARHERRISSFALLAGFVIDNFTLTRVDALSNHIILLSYLSLAGAGIIASALLADVARGRFLEWLYGVLPVLMQFVFGALFSAFIIYYSRSGSLFGSWPFILVLATLLIGNEALRKKYLRLGFQISIFFAVLFSYSIFTLPVLFGRIGVGVFLGSGAVSLVAIVIFIYLLSLFAPKRVSESSRAYSVGIVGIFALINFFYFYNIIPPIPLSLTEAGAYHSVSRTGNGAYRLRYEEESWLETARFGRRIHLLSGEPVFFYSAVFTPIAFDLEIVHDWQYYNESTKEWISSSRITFPISGGRDGGYRGYSVKENIKPGKWRVNIETKEGQLIGRVKFEVITVPAVPALQTALH